MLNNSFIASLEGKNQKHLFTETFDALFSTKDHPDSIWLDDREVELRSKTPNELLNDAARNLSVSWGEFGEAGVLSFDKDSALSLKITDQEFNAFDVLNTIKTLDWQVSAFASLYGTTWSKQFDYFAPSFANRHASLGWGCAFKGDGHNRIVSRRFLEFNPWRVIRDEEHDITLIQFHDLEADAKTALEQARVGHDIMGDPYMGGFIQKNYSVNNPDFSGLYSSDEKMLRFIIADREITKAEMLDACAIRLYQLLGKDQPVERVAFVFAYSSEFAKPYLHDLWLREIEVWAIDKGVESRLDLDYKPTLEKPDWVVALEEA
jgi:hypothetical protein